MTYHQRKQQQACTYPNCETPPLDDNAQCEGHRDAHRIRNRKWKRALMWRWEQLGWWA